jgi:hypothetical protein
MARYPPSYQGLLPCSYLATPFFRSMSFSLLSFPSLKMSINSTSKRDIVTLMMDFENGDLNEEQTIDLFQQLINSGSLSHLRGFYGQLASELIRNGYCKLSEVSHQVAYNNPMPSRDEAGSTTEAHQTSKFRLRCSTVNRSLFPSYFTMTSTNTSAAKDNDTNASTTKQRYRVNVESTDYLFADIWAEDESDAYQIAINLEPSDLRIMSSGSLWIDSVTVVTEDDELLEPFLPIN